MEDIKIRACKLCLSSINDENYELIEKVTKEILSVLFIKLDSEEDGKHVMCNVCSLKLQAALKFKSTCLYTNNTILSYVDNATLLPINLKEICMKERENVQIPDDIKICRLCMQQIKNALEFKSIKKEQVDMMHEFVPELNIFIIEEPVMCNLCQDSLEEHFNFLKKCSDAEKNISCISSVQNTASLDISVKLEDVDMDFEDVKPSIETEYLDIIDEVKTEREAQIQEICSEAKAFLKYNYKAMPSLDKHEIGHRNYKNMYKHNNCNYEMKNDTAIKTHMLKHKAKYRNRIVDYKIQQDPSKVQLHECNQCDFRNKFKANLRTHILIHNDPSEVKMYKCVNCNFETRYKQDIRSHVLKHKEPWEMQIYKCDNCNYITTRRGGLKEHMLIHKDPSQVQMYKCENCNYTTKRNGDLKKHMLIHKDPSQVQMYKCENCSYATKLKRCFKRHMLIHKDISELQMYKCENCIYATTRKDQLRDHMLIHKDPSQVQMYKCEKCNYAAKRKRNLKYHMMTHKNPLQVQMYKCEHCNYATKCKGTLTKHMLVHKDPSQVQMYNCESCNYATKRKGALKLHMLIHKKSSSTQFINYIS